MKKLIKIILILFLIIACKDATEKIGEATQAIDNLEKIADSAQDAQKNIEELAKMSPVTKETIKAWMPDELEDLKRTKYDIGKQMGFAQISNVQLTFKTEDKKKGIDVKIIDGAGNGASVISMNNLMLQVDVDSESETGYKRTEIFDGQKLLVDYSNPKYANRSLFKYIVDNRIYVEARGWQMEPNALWKYLKQLKIEKLLNP